MELSGILSGILKPNKREAAETKVETTRPQVLEIGGYSAPHITDLFLRAVRAKSTMMWSHTLTPFLFAYGTFKLLQRENGEFLQNFSYNGNTIFDRIRSSMSIFEDDLKRQEDKLKIDFPIYDENLINFLADTVNSRMKTETDSSLDHVEKFNLAHQELSQIKDYMETVFPIVKNGEVNKNFLNKNTTTTRKDIDALEVIINSTKYLDLHLLVLQRAKFRELTRLWEEENARRFAGISFEEC